jgi:DNA-binding NarL/FixJ family response regulator
MKRRPEGNRPTPPSQRDVQVFRMQHGQDDLLVVSVPLGREPPAGLTPAQLEVARAIARGASNAEIARERGTSVRTVANQVASIFARLGVRSRLQVAAALSRVLRLSGEE